MITVDGRIVDILGTTYKLREQNSVMNPKMKNANGLCETYSKELIIDPLDTTDPEDFDNIDSFKKRVIRHELIHAFFDESGLRGECKYAGNEELVDWIAIQLPKIVKVCKELDVLEVE